MSNVSGNDDMLLAVQMINVELDVVLICRSTGLVYGLLTV